MTQKTNSCPEFPYFVAWYPDARCIDGYLWDLDKYEDGMLYGGGDEPCPFCNSDAFVESKDDGEEGNNDEWIKWVEELHKKHNYVKSQTMETVQQHEWESPQYKNGVTAPYWVKECKFCKTRRIEGQQGGFIFEIYGYIDALTEEEPTCITR